MKKWGLGLLFVLACQHALALAVTDDRGVSVSLAAPPQRIVSLLPSLTESVCALGQCQRIVGVDRYSNWPARIKSLPQLGGGLDPDIEGIVALKPDLVLVAASSRAVERLHALGITVVALEPKSYGDVQRVLGTLATLLGLPAGDSAALWQRIEAGVVEAAHAVPPQVKGARLYFEVSRAPHAAGASSFIGETLTRLGVQNIVPAALGPFPKLNPEFVVRANPDIILLGEHSLEGLADRPGWAGIRAVREQRLCVFKPEESDVLLRPGPRIAEAAQLMAHCLVGKAPRSGVQAARR